MLRGFMLFLKQKGEKLWVVQVRKKVSVNNCLQIKKYAIMRLS